jgi:predicted transcriptional regulator of viral defense system
LFLPQKYRIFVAKSKRMAANSTYKAMENIVENCDNGAILFPDDFTICGTPDAIRSGLSRLCRTGKLQRFAKGIYYVPKYDKWDGSLREPSLDAVAQRIARRDHARIVPTGVYALNRMGLSTQVPTNIVYITDGSARKVTFGEGKSITFRHSNELGNFAYQSGVMQLAVMAMREIGEEAINEEQIEKIKQIISSSVSEEDFNHDIVLAPVWVKTILKQ